MTSISLSFACGRSKSDTAQLQSRRQRSYGTISYISGPSAARPGSTMPVFYFDYDDGEGNGEFHDAVGTQLHDLAAARIEGVVS